MSSYRNGMSSYTSFRGISKRVYNFFHGLVSSKESTCGTAAPSGDFPDELPVNQNIRMCKMTSG